MYDRRRSWPTSRPPGSTTPTPPPDPAATDPGLGAAGEWLARRTPSGVAWEHRHDQGDVAVRGRATDLLLVLSRRAALDGSWLEVSGDRRLLAHWLQHSRLEPA